MNGTASQDPEPLLPEVEVDCSVCGASDADEVCSSAELARQLDAARGFHHARLRWRSRAALEERASFTHDYPTRLLTCRRCGLLFRSPRPRADSVLHAYRQERYTAERLPQMIVSQRELFRPKARALARVLGAGGRVLEVGSFVGGFLRAAREIGLDACGIDPSEQLSMLCRRSGLRVACSTLETVAESESSPPFDAIAIWNTFDQFPRPREALAAALRVLRPGGLLALRVPHGTCFRRLIARDRPPLRELAWNNLLAFPYLHGYGFASLDRLAREFGLRWAWIAGDTLGTVSDASYAAWARLEERAVKASQRTRLARNVVHAPWLDVYLREGRMARFSHPAPDVPRGTQRSVPSVRSRGSL